MKNTILKVNMLLCIDIGRNKHHNKQGDIYGKFKTQIVFFVRTYEVFAINNYCPDKEINFFYHFFRIENVTQSRAISSHIILLSTFIMNMI